MSDSLVRAGQEVEVYRGYAPYPGRLGETRPSTRPWVQARFVDVRLHRAEWDFLLAAVELFDATGHVDPIEREDFDELVDLLGRHGRLARWGREMER